MANARIDFPGEVWKPLPGYEDRYEVSNLGRIWSVPRIIQTKISPRPSFHPHTGKILKARANKDGYVSVSIWRNDGRAKTIFVHAAVCAAFNGPRPDGYECAHLDGTRDNNIPSNLVWLTRRENAAHKVLHGTHSRGEKSPHAKVTSAAVDEMIRRAQNGERLKDLAVEYRLSPSSVSRLVNGKSWYLPEVRV